MNSKVEKLIKAGAEIEISINEAQGEKLITYMEEILEINKHINLTRITEEDEFIKLHILDSLTLLKYIKNPSAAILDVGTGGGFPGIPLAIMMEEATVTLLDSTKKKLIVVENIAKALNINNIRILHGRAEELGQDRKYRESYDIVTSRAVANLTLLSEYCLPLTKIGGKFLPMKGREYKNEITEAEKPIAVLGGEIKAMEECLILQSEWVHVIIVIEKIKKTPRILPRTNGKIKSEKFPLLLK
ncbi:MAG: 16S rRNA (guanine(527)-N(7))-methyltransferase RsmG [Acetobacterium sp.]